MSKKLTLSEKEIAEIRKKHETERNNYEFFSKKVFEPKKKIDEQTVSSVVSTGIESGKSLANKKFVARQNQDRKWIWVEGTPKEDELTTKEEFDTYIIYRRLKVPSSQWNQVNDFIKNVVTTLDGGGTMLSNEEVANILGETYDEKISLNPIITRDKDGSRNYSYYYKK